MKKAVEKVQPDVEEPSEKPPDAPWFIPDDPDQSIYRYIIAAARRARQLQGGARPSISTTSRKPTKIAMEEVRRGEVAVEIPTGEEPLEGEGGGPELVE